MESFTLWERFSLEKRKYASIDHGVNDAGIYYIVAIVIADHLESGSIVINGQKRIFFSKMIENVKTSNYFTYILENILTCAYTTTKWQKWAKHFLREYCKYNEFNIEIDKKFADDVLCYYPELLVMVNGVDEEEEFVNRKDFLGIFNICEMLQSVRNHYSQSELLQTKEEESFEEK